MQRATEIARHVTDQLAARSDAPTRESRPDFWLAVHLAVYDAYLAGRREAEEPTPR